MKEKYFQLYKIQEEFRIKLIADLQPYSEELLHTKPSPEAWSVAEIVAHLIAGDEYVFNYISKKMKDGSSADKTGNLARIKWIILKIAFFFPFKFKVPKSVTPSTEYATLKELEVKWEKASKAVYELLSNLDESEFHKNIWKHPRVGKINFIQMIDFAIDHSKRHENQIKRTIAKVENTIASKK